jgi:hypothetical protein
MWSLSFSFTSKRLYALLCPVRATCFAHLARIILVRSADHEGRVSENIVKLNIRTEATDCWECSTQERDVESVENLSWKNMEENMNTGFRWEIGCVPVLIGGMWLRIGSSSGAVVNAVMNLRVIKGEKYRFPLLNIHFRLVN